MFPASKYLATRWWHRLATACFWCWFAGVLFWVYYISVVEPWKSCIEFNARYDGKLDCSSSGISLALREAEKWSASDVIGMGLFIAVGLYALLVAPSLIYRLFLYVATGMAWREK